MEEPDYYSLLEVIPEAHEEVIRAAYQRLAKLHHPDHHPGDASAERKMRELNEARDVLCNRERRTAYDRRRQAEFEQRLRAEEHRRRREQAEKEGQRREQAERERRQREAAEDLLRQRAREDEERRREAERRSQAETERRRQEARAEAQRRQQDAAEESPRCKEAERLKQRCPICGVRYKWDGTHCGHCGHPDKLQAGGQNGEENRSETGKGVGNQNGESGPGPFIRARWAILAASVTGITAVVCTLCSIPNGRAPSSGVPAAASSSPEATRVVIPERLKTPSGGGKAVAAAGSPPVPSVLPKEPLAVEGKARRACVTPPRAEASQPSAPDTAPAVPSGSVGVVDKVEGILLRFSTEKREWERISDGASLETSDRLACLAPFQARIVVARAPITLLGETHLRVVTKAATDPCEVELADGRALIDPSAPAGTFKVGFSGRTVSIGRPVQVALGLERTGKWVYGQAPAFPPALAIHAATGVFKVALDQARVTLVAPGTVLADVSGRLKTSKVETLPVWLAATAASPKDRGQGEQFLQQFHRNRLVLADMVAATENESPVVKELAIFGIKAMQDLSLLTPILCRPGDPIARRSTAAALRWVLSQGPQARRKLREQLDEEFGVELGTIVEKLLIGYTPDEATKGETIRVLVALLGNQLVVVRELALDNLKTITHRGDLGYNPEKPDKKSLDAWNLAAEEQTKPAP